MRPFTKPDYDHEYSAFKRDHKVIERPVHEPEDYSQFHSTSRRNGACVVAKGSAAMPTDLTATASELSSRSQQLAVAAKPAAHDGRSENYDRTLRIQIAVVVEITASGFDVRLAGNITFRVSSG